MHEGAEHDPKGRHDVPTGDRTGHDLIEAGRVQGTPVYNRKGDHLGTVRTLMIEKRTGQVAYAVMDFGGFLGIGERHHPVPWEALDYDPASGGYVVDLDRERLEGAPSYAPQDPFWDNPRTRPEIFGYYSLPTRF